MQEDTAVESNVWKGCSDKELLDIEKYGAPVAFQCKKSSLNKFTLLENEDISKVSLFILELDRSDVYTLQVIIHDMKLKYSNTGVWTIYFDPCNIERAWAKLTVLYNANALFGITKLARPNETNPNKSESGLPILAFAGPCTNEKHCVRAGQNMVHLLAHKRQKCNKNYKGQIYYKMTKKDVLFPNGPRYYSVKYE